MPICRNDITLQKPIMEIIYKTDCVPDIDEIIAVYRSSGINRPIADRDRISKMYAEANLVVSAWHEKKLVGLARSLTDYCYCCYLSDLAVRLEYQQQGIGKKLVYLTKEVVGEKTTLILLAAPSAVDYYPKIGLTKFEHAFLINRSE